MKQYDYLIVGAGFYGAIFARELTNAGKKVLVIDKKKHIGGNCYTDNRDGINVHVYGPHIFHTNNKETWDWINQYADFNNFTLRPVANYNGETYSLPFNMWTFSKIWGITHPDEAKKIIEEQSKEIKGEPKNLEEQAIKLVGRDVYEKLIKGYTEKQWRKLATELPKEIIKRLPVRYTYDNNYFDDKFQGIPIGGYTQIFDKLLDDIDVILCVDWFKDTNNWLQMADKVIYTGPIDKFYDYKFGPLEYKTLEFDHQRLDKTNHQGIAMMNYTNKEIPYTRCIEHKHFDNVESDKTWITHEYSVEYNHKTKDPYYPVNDSKNNSRYAKYKALADLEDNVIFGGRLAEYKYYDMKDVIEMAINNVKKLT